MPKQLVISRAIAFPPIGKSPKKKWHSTQSTKKKASIISTVDEGAIRDSASLLRRLFRPTRHDE